MTPDKTPTDAELDAILCNQWPAFSMQATLVKLWLRAAMRDGIAKWGSPVVAGEPFCYVSVNKQGDITRTIKRKDKWTNIPLYLAPQPTQAQAGAVPLTEAQKREMATNWFAEDWAVSNAIGLIDDYETLQGITKEGGQHGDS